MASDAFSVSFDASGLYVALEKLEYKAALSARPAAQAGAQVLYDEVIRFVPVANAPHVMDYGRVIQPGALKESIYQVYSKSRSNDHTKTYHVSWNAKKAPHGHLVEFGYMKTRQTFKSKKDGRWYTSKNKLDVPYRVAPIPFLRTAFEVAQSRALEAARQRWVLDMQLVLGAL
jgi:hypothetical protein